ncbi:hypothetical protein V490_03151 [Pseudogymnoascus sp. VKM F-3557]|nr:hypothetical protein V490_03151 [Pseudogymnoascus sp. VKM F-3557]
MRAGDLKMHEAATISVWAVHPATSWVIGEPSGDITTTIHSTVKMQFPVVLKRAVFANAILASYAVSALSISPQVPLDNAGSESVSLSGLLSLHKSLIEIPSISNSEYEVGQWLASYLKGEGFTVKSQVVSTDPPRENIYAYIGSAHKTRTLITSHIDTVPPYWPYERRGNEIWGRGSVDAKGAVAAQIKAVEALRDSKSISEGDVGMLFVVGEEVNGVGMLKVNELGLSWDTVIFGEPTELKLASGHKGILKVRIDAHGKGGHSGYPEVGRNANDMLIPALAELAKIDWPRSERFGNTTYNIGRMEGGVADNVIAAEAYAIVSVRVADGDPEVLKRTISDTLLAVSPDVKITYGPGSYGPVPIDHDVEGFETIVVNYGTDILHLDGDHKRRRFLGPQAMILSPSLYLGIFSPPFCPRATLPALSQPFATHHYPLPIMARQRSIQIIFDFDGTITTKDTIEPLVQAAISLHHPSLPASELSQTPEAKSWSECKSQYLADLSAHYEKEKHESSDGNAVTGPSGLKKEQRTLDALRDVEWASVQRVGDSGIFKGISRESFLENGRAAAAGDPEGRNDGVVLRKGFSEFVTWIRQRWMAEWKVVSVNWNWRWVRGILEVAVGEPGRPMAYGKVVANDIEASTGMIIGYPLHRLNSKRTHLLTTADKLLAQRIIIDRFDLGMDSPEPLTVYIGDSPTDLSPLLNADIGIIMNHTPSPPGAPSELVDKCGYRVIPVSQYKELYCERENERVAILLSANDFTEIMESGVLDEQEWDPTAAKEAWKKAESKS